MKTEIDKSKDMGLAYAMRSRRELHHDAVEGGTKLSNTSSRHFSREIETGVRAFFFFGSTMTSRRARTCTAHETLTFFDRFKEGSGLNCRLYRPEGLLEEPEGELGIDHWEEVST